MKNRILILVAVIGLFCSVDASAQQDAQYTQYMYNTLSINPAYAGARDGLSALVLYRTQWVGLDGAPDTGTFNIHSPLGDEGKIGLGLSVVNDRIGPTQETFLDASFSYSIDTSDKGKLSLGINAGGSLLDIKYSELNTYNNGDPLLANDVDNKFSPQFGAGIYYRSADTWYLGLSVPNMLETKYLDNGTLSEASERMHFYLMGGYVFDINTDLKLKPAFLAKAVSGAPLQADLTVNALYKYKFTVGLAYRWSAAVSGLLGYQVSDSVMLGFGYDREVTDLGMTKFDSGSFEVFLRFEPKDLTKILSPRFF